VREILNKIASQYGTPCYVYFLDHVKDRIQSLHDTFEKRFHISYAVKSNPNLALLSWLREQVPALDISSVGELNRAVEAGWETERISFTGPGKRPNELRAAIEHGVGEVILESVAEAELLNQLAGEARKIQPVMLRIAPKRMPRGFGVNMAGKPSQFGVDEEDADPAVQRIKCLPHLDLIGFHIYSGSQCLKSDSIAENYEIFIDLFKRVSKTHDIKPSKLIFGAGLGIPYYESDQPVDLQAVADRINPQLDQLKRDPQFMETTLTLELGRYLVGEAGFYLTSVTAMKHSRGVDICICDGGMNHHLGACGHLGSVIHRNYRIFKVTEDAASQTQPYELVGPLCTTIDTLGHGVQLPGLEVGDVIGIHCSGAYGLSASPIHFIGHALPKEILVRSQGGQTVTEVVN